MEVVWRTDITIVDSLIPEYGGNMHNISGIEDKVKVNISDVRDHSSMEYLVADKDCKHINVMERGL